MKWLESCDLLTFPFQGRVTACQMGFTDFHNSQHWDTSHHLSIRNRLNSGLAKWLNNAAYSLKRAHFQLCRISHCHFSPLWLVVSFLEQMSPTTSLQIGPQHFGYRGGTYALIWVDTNWMNWAPEWQRRKAFTLSSGDRKLKSQWCDSHP